MKKNIYRYQTANFNHITVHEVYQNQTSVMYTVKKQILFVIIGISTTQFATLCYQFYLVEHELGPVLDDGLLTYDELLLLVGVL